MGALMSNSQPGDHFFLQAFCWRPIGAGRQEVRHNDPEGKEHLDSAGVSDFKQAGAPSEHHLPQQEIEVRGASRHQHSGSADVFEDAGKACSRCWLGKGKGEGEGGWQCGYG